MRFFLFALALVSAPAISAPPPDCYVPGLPKIKGKSYHTARAMLIEAGFRPIMRKADPDMGIEMDAPHAFGYYEASACSGTGYAYCFYDWHTPKAKSTFGISAIAEFGPVKHISCDPIE
jgi:hypothetical protein